MKYKVYGVGQFLQPISIITEFCKPIEAENVSELGVALIALEAKRWPNECQKSLGPILAICQCAYKDGAFIFRVGHEKMIEAFGGTDLYIEPIIFA